ncbi:MAG: hypothetical protein FIA92_01415 [Chloroflexi bacterium]|nr:hypothetical protein [Chloroflexota bacterium]
MESRTARERAGDASGRLPAEGREDLGIPGADRDEDLPPSTPEGESPGGVPSPEQGRRDDLARRAERESPGLGTEGEPDVLPDVEVPRHQM